MGKRKNKIHSFLIYFQIVKHIIKGKNKSKEIENDGVCSAFSRILRTDLKGFKRTK